MTTTLKVTAANAYDSKDDLKDNGFVWNKEDKTWEREFASEEEYNEFMDHFMNVSYYGRHAVNKFHSKVVFTVVEIADEEGETETEELEEKETLNQDMDKKEKYIALLNEIEENRYRILSITAVDSDADLVVFEYGDGDGKSSAVIYDDDTVFTQWDWLEAYPKSVGDISRLKWRLGATEREAFVISGLPRLFPM